jgi:hypothetical protein
MLKRIFYFISLFAWMIVAPAASAICPVCTIAVGAGVGLSRWLGVDDVISGLWIGGLTVSMIMWTINWLDKKNIKFKGRKILITAAYYLLIVAPLYYSDIIGHPYNKFWGVDKILLGAALGSMAFFAGSMWYLNLKKKNNDRAHFPFQKVVMSICPILLLTLIFYFVTK